MVRPASTAGAAVSASSTGKPATWASTSEGVVVLVVPAGPGVGRGLRPALGGVLPGLLAAVRRDVEEAPGRPERLVAAGVDEVGPVDLVAVAQEHVRAVPLGDVVVGVEVVAQRVPGELPAHVRAISPSPRGSSASGGAWPRGRHARECAPSPARAAPRARRATARA